jgi:hypothetical protein
MKKFLQFDAFAQGIIGLFIIATLLVTLITRDAWLIWGLFSWMLLGFWQVVSALITWLLMGLRNRGYYLLAVLAYGLIAAGIISLESRGLFTGDKDWWFLATFILLPVPYAIWYFRATFRTWKSSESPAPRTFWDLG